MFHAIITMLHVVNEQTIKFIQEKLERWIERHSDNIRLAEICILNI